MWTCIAKCVELNILTRGKKKNLGVNESLRDDVRLGCVLNTRISLAKAAFGQRCWLWIAPKFLHKKSIEKKFYKGHIPPTNHGVYFHCWAAVKRQSFHFHIKWCWTLETPQNILLSLHLFIPLSIALFMCLCCHLLSHIFLLTWVFHLSGSVLGQFV